MSAIAPKANVGGAGPDADAGPAAAPARAAGGGVYGGVYDCSGGAARGGI